MIIGIPNGYDPRYFASAAMAVATVAVVWLVSVAVTGWLAGRRHRDDGLWAFLALLAGPLALLVLLLLPPRSAAEPEAQSGPTYRVAAAAPEWPVFPDREPRMTSRQRTVATVLAAMLGGVGAALQASDAVRPLLPIVVAAGFVGAAIVARWLAPSLVPAGLGGKVWIIIAAAAAAVSIRAVLIVALVGGAGVLHGDVAIDAILLYLLAAAFSPIISAVFEPAPFVAAVAVTAAWVFAMSALIARNPASSLAARVT